MSDIDVVGKCRAVCDLSASSYEFIEFSYSEYFILIASLKLNQPFIIVHRIGIQIPADKVHIGKVHIRGFVESERCFCAFDLINVDLFLIDLRSQHADDEILHCGVFICFLEGFDHLNGADEDVNRHEISSKVNRSLLEVNFLSIQ